MCVKGSAQMALKWFDVCSSNGVLVADPVDVRQLANSHRKCRLLARLLAILLPIAWRLALQSPTYLTQSPPFTFLGTNKQV